MQCRPAITSMSLGRAWVHDLQSKLDQAASSGLEGIELFYEDLQYFAKDLSLGKSMNEDDALILAAQRVKELCDDRGLTILCLQPFMHYEGLKCPIQHAKRIRELKLLFRVVKKLDTTLIMIPSNFLPKEELSSNLDDHVVDLVEAADLGAKEDPPINFAYEAMAWGTYIDTWEQTWDMVQKVDRPNFGICLDTFQIAGRVYADPAALSGTTGPDALDVTRRNIENLRTTIDVKKVFNVQLVSGERLEKPLLPGHEYYAADQPPRMSWSRNCRLFYDEADRGDYLPVHELAAAIFDSSYGLGYRGWVSAELFNRSLMEPAESVPEEHAKRAMDSYRKLAQNFSLDTNDS